MPTIDVKKKRIQSKIVYCGPGMSGKTEVLRYIHEHLAESERGRFASLPTRTDPSLHIDVLPVHFSKIIGFDSVFHLCSAPGRAFSISTRKLLLRDTDGIVFVADCDPKRRMANVDALHELRENLDSYGLRLDAVPHVIQYNKCELANRTSTSDLRGELNEHGAPDFESSIKTGAGILEALRAVVRRVTEDLQRRI